MTYDALRSRMTPSRPIGTNPIVRERSNRAPRVDHTITRSFGGACGHGWEHVSYDGIVAIHVRNDVIVGVVRGDKYDDTRCPLATRWDRAPSHDAMMRDDGMTINVARVTNGRMYD